MRKIETIWHHILHTALTDKVFKHTQQELAQEFGYSLSTIHHALSVPTQIGAIRKESKYFVLEDAIKLLYFWASIRNTQRSIIYTTYFSAPVRQIEGLLLPTSIYACYSAATRHLGEASADYTSCYFYESETNIPEVEKRFPRLAIHTPNIVVLKKIAVMEKYGNITTLAQTFVDIWNLRDWFSKDFTRELEEKIHGLLS